NLGIDAGFVRDHFLETLQVGHHRRFVHHSDLADDRGAIREDTGVVRPNHIRADTHEVWEALRHNTEVATLNPRAPRVENHYAGSTRGRRNHLAAGTFEGHERNDFPIPRHRADIPRRCAGHFRWDLKPNDLGNTGARDDQATVDDRHE